MDAREKAAEKAEEAREEVRPWVKPFARWGYAANGLVYVLVGYLALRAALGPSDPSVTRQEALIELVTRPLGQILLFFIALGLVGYALGQIMRAAISPEKTDKKGVVDVGNRAVHAFSGLIHLSLALFAAQLVFSVGGSRNGGGNNASEDWTARVMAYPMGRWLIALAGLVIVGIAIYALYKAYSARFRDSFDRAHMSFSEKRWLTVLGRIGYVARGIVYGIIGMFILQAARQYDPEEAGGLGEALAALAAQPYGPWLLGAVAVGLMAYGLYGMLLGKYRDLDF